MDAPTASELQTNPVVQAAFEAAWADSLAADPVKRHEEGGYIYANPDTGEIAIRRALPGDRRRILLSRPPIVPGYYLVATYHTHPNPISLGWDPEPSEDDRYHADDSGVPWFVRSELGVRVTGPDRRVGGLTGNPGYPL